MPDAPVHIQTLAELRDYVHRVLCDHENLIAEQFRLQELSLMRRGRCCGRQFLLQGPRSVRLGAVWASDQNELFCYNARGERFLKERLPGTIAVNQEAA